MYEDKTRSIVVTIWHIEPWYHPGNDREKALYPAFLIQYYSIRNESYSILICHNRAYLYQLFINWYEPWYPSSIISVTIVESFFNDFSPVPRLSLVFSINIFISRFANILFHSIWFNQGISFVDSLLLIRCRSRWHSSSHCFTIVNMFEIKSSSRSEITDFVGVVLTGKYLIFGWWKDRLYWLWNPLLC